MPWRSRQIVLQETDEEGQGRGDVHEKDLEMQQERQKVFKSPEKSVEEHVKEDESEEE